MSDVIGTASILVTADGSDFAKSMQKLNGTIEGVADKAGKNAGAALADSVGATASKAIGSVGRIVGQQLEKAVVPATQAAGQKAQSAFSKGLDGIVSTANASAARVGDALKTKIVGAATASAEKVSSVFQNLVPSGVGRAAEKAGDFFKARLSSATDKAARVASSNVGGVLISGMANVAAKANSAFQKGFKIAASAVKEAGRAVAEASKKLASGLSEGAKKAGGAAGKMLAVGLKATAIGALAAVAAVATGVLTKGFGRLTNIDTATKKLEGLGIVGDDLKMTMDNALRAVEGTAFGLDEAAMAAGQFAAAGLKPGGQMEQALSGLANVSAVAGRSMADMSGIFTDAAASGKITGDTLMRLEQSGIAASQMMAEEMGISVDELRKKVSDGEVSFEEFASTIEGPLGKAATIMGTSFKGMVANIGAAMGRVGASALAPVFEGLKSVMPNVIELFNRLGTALQPFIDKIAPHITAFFGWLGGALDKIDFGAATSGAGSFADILINISTGIQDWFMKALTGLPELLGELLPKMAEAMVSKISFLLGAIGGIVTAVSSALVTYLPLLVQKFVSFLPLLVAQIKTLVPMLLSGVVHLVTAVAASLPTLIPMLIEAGVTIFMGLVESLLTLVVPLVEGLIVVLGSVVEALINSAPILYEAGLTFFLTMVESVLSMLPTLLTTLFGLVGPIINAVVKMIPSLLNAAIQLFTMLIDAVIQILPGLLTTLVGILPGLITTLLGLIPQLIQGAITLFTALVDAIPVIIPMLIIAIVQLLPEILMAVVSMIPALLEAAFDLFMALVMAIPKIILELGPALRDMWPTIKDELVKMGPKLLQAGKDLISGLINGIKSMGGKLITSIRETVTDKLPGFVKKALGIKSPSTVFEGFGHNIIRGLVSGLDGSAKEVSNSMERIVAKIMDSKLTDGSKSPMVKFVEAQGSALIKALDQQKFVADRLKKANEMLENLHSDRESMFSEVSGGLKGEFSLGNYVKTNSKTGESKAMTFEQIASKVSAIAGRMKTFAGKLRDLISVGFPSALVQQIAGLGSSQGIAVADAMLSATDAQAQAFMSDYGALTSWSDAAGAAVADDFFTMGVQAQNGLIAGLESQSSELEAAAKSISDKLTNYVRSNLGIQSPSKVFEGIGRFLGAGLINGVNAMAAPAAAAVGRMVSVPEVGFTTPGVPSGAARSALQVPSAGGSTQTGNVTINVELRMDDIAQLKTLEDFMGLLRVKTRMGSTARREF